MKKTGIIIVSAVLLVLLICSAGCVNSNPYAEMDWSMTLVGADGTEKTLSVADIAAMPAVEGHGYAVSTTGIKYGPYKVKGVSLTDLLNEVGGVKEGQYVHVSAADGYLWVFSYEQVLGEDLLCLTSELKEMKEPVPMHPILMYEADGEPFPYDDGGPLRICIMTDVPDVITEGSLWVKWADRIEVH